MDAWGRERSAELTALVDAALPGEDVSEDELVACLWDDDDPTLVVGSGDGSAAGAAVVHRRGDDRIGFVQLVAVAPNGRRKGAGRAVVGALQEWAFEEHGARAMAVGGCAPYYLWPGVDVHMTSALCLFEAMGYRPRGAELNMTFAARHRAPAPAGSHVRRVLDDTDAVAAVEFCQARWPNWVAEVRRAIDHGSCLVALDDASGEVVGFGCHSVNRLGWLGPMATDPDRQHRGVGNALLGAIATDVMAAGLGQVEVAWVGPVRFYAKAAGATISRAFRTPGLARP